MEYDAMREIAEAHNLVPAPPGYTPGQGDAILYRAPNDSWRKATILRSNANYAVYKTNRHDQKFPVDQVGSNVGDSLAFVAISPSVIRMFGLLSESGGSAPNPKHVCADELTKFIALVDKNRAKWGDAKSDKFIAVCKSIAAFMKR